MHNDKRRWLERYRQATIKMERLRLEVNACRSAATSLSQALDGMPHCGGGGDKIPRAVEQLMDAQKDLEVEAARCEQLRYEIREAISRVEVWRYREILTRMFILFQRPDDIADALYISRSTFYDSLDRAYQAVEIPKEWTK